MILTASEHQFLLERKQEIEREIRRLQQGNQRGPCYHEMNERRVDLIDELSRVEAELQEARIE